MQEFKVPELGENVSQGDVTRVLVKVGDTIKKEQSVVELETDKATIEVPSSVEGTVKEIKVKPGEKVKVGSVILTVDENGAAAAPQEDAKQDKKEKPAEKDAKPEPKQEAKKEEKAPEKVVSMPKREPSSTPAASSKQQEPAAKAGAPEPRAEAPAAPKRAPEPRAEAGPAPLAAPASPSVRRLAREIGVDINEVQGSGPGDRITEDDVKEHARRILSSIPLGTGGMAARPAGAPAASVPLPDFSKWGEIDRQPMTNIRRKTAEHLSHAWNTIPHVTQFDKADITPMEELRAKFRKQVKEAGGNLTVTAVLVKVLAAAVKQFPQFNASLDIDNNAIVYKKYINVGVAVDTEHGLLVPVIRNADEKNIQDIAV